MGSTKSHCTLVARETQGGGGLGGGDGAFVTSELLGVSKPSSSSCGVGTQLSLGVSGTIMFSVFSISSSSISPFKNQISEFLELFI